MNFENLKIVARWWNDLNIHNEMSEQEFIALIMENKSMIDTLNFTVLTEAIDVTSEEYVRTHRDFVVFVLEFYWENEHEINTTGNTRDHIRIKSLEEVAKKILNVGGVK